VTVRAAKTRKDDDARRAPGAAAGGVVKTAKITNPDVYKLPLAGMRACLDSIEHAFDEDGGTTVEDHDAVFRAYEVLLSVQNHIVNGYPLEEDC
jgi:hypothetical protein